MEYFSDGNEMLKNGYGKRKKTAPVTSGARMFYWINILVSITRFWFVCCYGTNPLGKVRSWSWSLEEALGTCSACRKCCCDFVGSPTKTSLFELVLSQYWHNVRKQYDHTWDDMQTHTYPDTKDSRSHLLLSYPGCGMTLHIHLVWNPTELLFEIENDRCSYE